MHTRWLLSLALLIGIAAAVVVAAKTLGLGAGGSQAQVRPVPVGHQEIAWIAPATSGDGWERLVAALKQLQQDWPKLHGGAKLDVGLDKAFLDLTADVPEVALSMGGPEAPRLWVRWYKLSGDNDSRQWIANLRERGTPPLAVVGGDTSDRALALAQALAEVRDRWQGAAPLLLISTATAERYVPKDRAAEFTSHEAWPKLMGVYPDRSFRFAFTNTRMVQAVLDFVRQTPQVWLQKSVEPALLAGIPAAGEAWTSLSLLAAAGHLQPYFLYAVPWGDDRYSMDLAEIFFNQFAVQTQNRTGNNLEDPVPYSVGDQYQANPRERLAVEVFLNNRNELRNPQHLLVLPTGAQRARRFLRALQGQAPTEMRHFVVVNGDAISFNTIYRDRDVAWNILDMPVPLVFFSHRNPIDPTAGFDPVTGTTGTHDLLLYRDIFDALVQTSFAAPGRLDGADAVREGLKELRWRHRHVHASGPKTGPEAGQLFFDADGDRAPGSGEHIVWLEPAFEGARNLPRATIRVWHVAGSGWRQSGRPLEVFYNRSSREGPAGG